jgi:hypothetical protein
MQTKNFDAKNWGINVNGIPVTRLVEKESITVKRSEDRYTKQVGRLGEVTRSRQHNKTGEISFKLMQSSPNNDQFSLLAQLDEQANAGIVSIVIKDFNSATEFTCAEAWIRKNPDENLGTDEKEREWVFECADLDEFFGGAIN